MGKVWSIQYLRALAALGVVLYHLGERAGHPIKIGAAGVDLFFVISGFIMWMISEGETPISFGLSRLWRIVPMYWAVTLLLFAKHVMEHQSPGVWRLVFSMFFVPHVNEQGEYFPILVPGWTLNFEMFFYLVFGLCLLIADRRRQMLALSVALVLSIGVAALMRLPLQYPLLAEFLAGVWLCEFWRRGWLTRGPILVVAGVALFALGRLAPFSEALRPILWGVPAFLVVAGSLAMEPKLPKWPWLKALGDSSYSLYLTHGLVIGVLWSRIGWWGGLAAVVVSLGLFYGVERPLHRIFDFSNAGRLRRARASQNQ